MDIMIISINIVLIIFANNFLKEDYLQDYAVEEYLVKID